MWLLEVLGALDVTSLELIVVAAVNDAVCDSTIPVGERIFHEFHQGLWGNAINIWHARAGLARQHGRR